MSNANSNSNGSSNSSLPLPGSDVSIPHLGDPLVGRLLSYDALEQSFRTFKVRRDPACPACGPDAGEIVIAEYDDLCMPHAH